MTIFDIIITTLFYFAQGSLFYFAIKHVCEHDIKVWRLRRKWRGVDEKLLDKQQEQLYQEFLKMFACFKDTPQKNNEMDRAGGRVVGIELAKLTQFIAARRSNERGK